MRSQIDGTLRSTIPGADVWLLNPSGVVFGEGAQLDVRGSFHAGDGRLRGASRTASASQRTPRSQGVLSTAPPAAFGFLPGSRAAALAVERSRLEVDPGKTLELVGGDVSLDATRSSPRGAATWASRRRARSRSRDLSWT